ncbi:C-C motif chemokine 20-like [Clupea harengus]|uniref:C-C motif chemokine 20-like n=1 Tax=Clupea harengus TaxID=7950 RepID=A0A6P8EWJ9_CLUHA|nr:C-C motif chemokine 20-like [Clupea harengus]
MAKISVPALTLIMLCTLVLFSSEAAALRRVSRCCTRYSNSKVLTKDIKGISIQKRNGKCNINAVIVHTTTGKHICVDPNQMTDITDKLK